MAHIQLLVLDFDGTLLGRRDEFSLYGELAEEIKRLAAWNGAQWTISTGRSQRSFWDVFLPMRMVGLEPDFVVVEHAFIFRRTRFGYLPHFSWNLRTRYLLWKNRMRIRLAINDWQRKVTIGLRGARTVLKTSSRLCLRFDTQEAADVAGDLLTQEALSHPLLMVFKYLTEVDIRAIPFTKGLAVSELARHLGIGPAGILAIGDGHNDISMLNGSVAAMTGCPMNSEAEVIETVHKAGGHIASVPSMAGVLEIIRATRNGTVNSELPEWWQPPSGRSEPSVRPSRGASTGGALTSLVSLAVCIGRCTSHWSCLHIFEVIPFSNSGHASISSAHGDA